jgi:MFS transporter, DHA1 family, multidrug resistance protein
MRLSVTGATQSRSLDQSSHGWPKIWQESVNASLIAPYDEARRTATITTRPYVYRYTTRSRRYVSTCILTMLDIVRDSVFGQIAFKIFRVQAFQYPEDRSDCEPPNSWKETASREGSGNDATHLSPAPTKESQALRSPVGGKVDDLEANGDLVLHPYTSRECNTASVKSRGSTGIEGRPSTEKHSEADKTIIDWYSAIDPDNPQNWSSKKKLFVTVQICIYTFSVYIGSSLFVAGEDDIRSDFHVGETAAELGLALYVLAYGMGPMLWSPLSEIPFIGRNVIYIATFAMFVLLSLAAALVRTFAGVLILRFLLGFFG